MQWHGKMAVGERKRGREEDMVEGTGRHGYVAIKKAWWGGVRGIVSLEKGPGSKETWWIWGAAQKARRCGTVAKETCGSVRLHGVVVCCKEGMVEWTGSHGAVAKKAWRSGL